MAHDYIYDRPVLLGTQRVRPDLANAGLRVDAMAVLVRLWDARTIDHLDAAHSLMPSYKYLFEVRKIGRTPSPDALVVEPKFAAAPGYEIVPTAGGARPGGVCGEFAPRPYLFEAPPPPGAINANTPAGGTNAPAAGPMRRRESTEGPAAGSGAPALPGGTNAAKP